MVKKKKNKKEGKEERKTMIYNFILFFCFSELIIRT